MLLWHGKQDNDTEDTNFNPHPGEGEPKRSDTAAGNN